MLRAEIDRLLEQRPIPWRDIVRAMARAALSSDPADLEGVLTVARLDDVMDQTIAYPALAVLPAWGEPGVVALVQMAFQGPHSAAALNVLATIAAGRALESADLPFLGKEWEDVRRYPMPAGVPAVALRELRRVILSSLADEYAISRLLGNISFQSFFGDKGGKANERLNLFLHLLIDTHLVVNEPILDEFADLLATRPTREEDLHQFLVAHPVLLDPLATEVRTKHELGSDFIADFIVRRANDSYIAVELEHSADELFTKKGTLSAALLEAEGQVRDFQAWIHQNIAYAQKKLPRIHRPEGLIVIGRRVQLDESAQRRLEEENYMRRSLMRIVTYDDLLEQGRTVYRNMERPVVLRARDQRTI